MAEIEGTDDFQNMLAKLKQRVNDIATVKANVTAKDSGADLRESIIKFTETIQSGFALLLDAKSAELERLGTMAAEAIAVNKVGDSSAAELKREMASVGNTLNTMGSTIETLSNTVKDMKTTVEQLKTGGGDKGGITTQKGDPASAATGTDVAINYVETIRSEFNGEMKEIKALIEKEIHEVKSQTLEFLNFITGKIVGLQGKIDMLSRPGGGPPSPVSRPQPQDSASVHIADRTGGIDSALQKEIALIKDDLVKIIRFMIALSKR